MCNHGYRRVHVCVDMCGDMHIETYRDMCGDMCRDMCADACIDMCRDMCRDMCADACIDMCRDMCRDMCADACIDMRQAYVGRHAYGQIRGKGHAYTHMYRDVCIYCVWTSMTI